jgi:hypothetical protein
MTPHDCLARLDELLALQERLNTEVRRQFGPAGSPLRELSADDRKKARALIADLNTLIIDLAAERDRAGRLMRGTMRTMNANLAYLNTGRSLSRFARGRRT